MLNQTLIWGEKAKKADNHKKLQRKDLSDFPQSDQCQQLAILIENSPPFGSGGDRPQRQDQNATDESGGGNQPKASPNQAPAGTAEMEAMEKVSMINVTTFVLSLPV